MPHLSLIGLSGSLRAASTNTMLVHNAARLFGAANFTLGNLRLPLYNGDLERTDGIPSEVQTLADQIAAADAVIISTPEYNKGLSGVLKNAFDWVSRTDGKPWNAKPVAVMSAAAGRSGGERGQAMLRQALVAFRPRLLTGPEVHVAQTADQFDNTGTLINAQYERTLTELMALLRAETERR